MIVMAAEQVFAWPECGGVAVAHTGFSHLLAGHQNLLHKDRSGFTNVFAMASVFGSIEVPPAVDPCLFGSGKVGKRRRRPDDDVRIFADFNRTNVLVDAKLLRRV